MENIDCPFSKECANYGIHCNECKWNRSLNIGDYLCIKEKKLILLEKDGTLTREGLYIMPDVD